MTTFNVAKILTLAVVVCTVMTGVSSRPGTTAVFLTSSNVDVVRVRRAVFDLIPSAAAVVPADHADMMTNNQRQKELVGLFRPSSAAAAGTSCVCSSSDGTRTCVLDSRLRCRRLLSFPTQVEEEEEEEGEEEGRETAEEEEKEEARMAEKLHNSRRHVKRRLASLFLKWLKMEESRRLAAAVIAATE
jgi:hypothetical protein